MSEPVFKPVPRWLENSIIEGLQMLLTLRLRNAPPSDTIEAVVDVWVALFMARPIGWDEARDVPRLHRAFVTVGGRLDAWPAPVQIFDAMPPLKQKLLTSQVKCSIPTEETKRMMGEMKSLLASWTVKQPKQMSSQEADRKIKQHQRKKL